MSSTDCVAIHGAGVSQQRSKMRHHYHEYYDFKHDEVEDAPARPLEEFIKHNSVQSVVDPPCHKLALRNRFMSGLSHQNENGYGNQAQVRTNNQQRTPQMSHQMNHMIPGDLSMTTSIKPTAVAFAAWECVLPLACFVFHG
jgi:hypothetical protein